MSFRTQLDRSDLELTPSHDRETQGVILGEYLTSSWTRCASALCWQISHTDTVTTESCTEQRYHADWASAALQKR